MKSLPKDSRVFGTIALVGLLLLAPGCGNNTGLVPVSGKVQFENRDLPEVCRLTFVPTGGQAPGQSRSNGATMKPGGQYELTKFRGVSGLYPGEYKVTVAYYDLKPGGNEDVEGDWKEVVIDLPDKLVVEADAGRVSFDVVVP